MGFLRFQDLHSMSSYLCKRHPFGKDKKDTQRHPKYWDTQFVFTLIYYDYFYHSVGLSLFADKTVRNNVQTEVRTSVPSTYLTSSPLCGINRTVLRIEYLKESFILPSLQY